MRHAALIAIFLVVASASLTIVNAAENEPPKPPSVRFLAFSPDGRSLAVSHRYRNDLVVWDLEARTRKFTANHPKAVTTVAYSPSGDTLALGTINLVQILDPATGELRRELKDPK